MKRDISELLKDRRWQAELPASKEALEQLLSRSNLPLPTDYLNFLRFSNGGSGVLTVQPYFFRLWAAKQVLDTNLEYSMPEYVPGFLGIGDNGGGEFLAFDTRTATPWKIVSIPFVPMEEQAAFDVAEDFLALITYLETDPAGTGLSPVKA